MDPKQILNSSYLDILFEGKNKKYGGYELRKKYPRRAAVAGLLAILAVGGVFGAMLIKPKPKDDGIYNDVPVVTEMQNLEPPPPLKENEPPPPPPPAAPPPMKPTVKFTVPDIKKDDEVVQEAKLTEPPKDNKTDVNIVTQEGSNDDDAVGIDLTSVGGTGPAGPAGGGGEGTGQDDKFIHRNIQDKASSPYDWYGYLSKNLKYPNVARENDIQGRIIVEFVVEKDGSITQVRVVRGKELGNGLPEEAVRVVSSAPKWTPGKQNGHPVRSYMTLPIVFKLQ
jgi:protein TonB